ncbi:MAG: hypothetical protein UD961_02010 [Bacteroidales bacterium]|nr:hypothetical protein [Bacteroidales bacterium]
MKRTIIAMAAILSLQSCCHKLYPHTTEVTEKTESVTETIRDTVIMVQPDSSIIQALIQCDSTGRARLQEINALKESARLQQTISMEPEPQPYKPTVITVKATIDSMGIYLTYKEHYKETAEIQKIETIIEKEVNVLKWWQKLFIWLGSISTILIILTLVYALVKLMVKLGIVKYNGIK